MRQWLPSAPHDYHRMPGRNADEAMITIAKRVTEFGVIVVYRSRSSGSHIYYEDDWCQSEVDRNGVSLAPYVHALHGLIAQTQARDVLMIGCGGGTLGTLLARAGRSVTIVEVNAESIALARRYFSLPPEVSCHVEDGRSFLERQQRVYDAIVVDAFAAGAIPKHLCSVAFFRLACRRLADSGCIYFNVLVEHDLDPGADVLAGRMADSGLQVRLLDTPGKIERNAIVMGGAVADLRPPALLVTPETSGDELIEELEQMHFRAWRTPRVAVHKPSTPVGSVALGTCRRNGLDPEES